MLFIISLNVAAKIIGRNTPPQQRYVFPNKVTLFWNQEYTASCLRAVYLAAARRCSGEEERKAELRQRTRESVVRKPSSPRRVRAGPAGPPEEDPREREPRCHGRGLSPGNRDVKPAHTACNTGGRRQELWRAAAAAGDGEAAVGEPHEAACYVSGDPGSYY